MSDTKSLLTIALGGLAAYLVLTRLGSQPGAAGVSVMPGDGDMDMPTVPGNGAAAAANGELRIKTDSLDLYTRGPTAQGVIETGGLVPGFYTTAPYEEIAKIAGLVQTVGVAQGWTAPGGESLAQYYTPAHLAEAYPGIEAYL